MQIEKTNMIAVKTMSCDSKWLIKCPLPARSLKAYQRMDVLGFQTKGRFIFNTTRESFTLEHFKHRLALIHGRLVVHTLIRREHFLHYTVDDLLLLVD